MKTIPHILSLSILSIGLSGCLSSTMEEADFVSKVSDISLTVNGRTQMKFDEETHQIAYDETNLQFRVMDDDLNNYFVVTMDSMPQKVGDVISATVIYTTQDDIPHIKAEFTVSRYEDDKFWLWDDSGKTGVVISILH